MLTTAGSTAGCGKPHVRWCGRLTGRNPRGPIRSLGYEDAASRLKNGACETMCLPSCVGDQ